MNIEDKIDEFLDRGVEKIYPSREFLREKLLKGEKLSMYLGIDPTGPTLHLGHVIPLLKLAQFQALGQQAILLIGDFTATIGDPTDKMATRVPLTLKQVLDNATLYKKQASSLLKFTGVNSAKLKYNSRWLNKLSLADVTHLLSHITYAQTIKRDMFQKRIEEGKDLYLHEFLYPALQGYDSVAMGVDGEVGGNDQTFNMLMGRDLLKRMKNKDKFVISMKLLVDDSGKKMGKTEGNMITLGENPLEMFGKVMSWPDNFIIPGMELCTTLGMSVVDEARNDLDTGKNPRDTKLKLASAIVAMYHGKIKAEQALNNFIATFSKKEIPENITEIKTVAGTLLCDSLMVAGLIGSKSEWRRLVGEKAITRVAPDGVATKVMDFNFKIESPAVFKIGKHRFLKVIL